ncbi:MAG: cadherin-like beta sandwich domain-containing protein [Clostridia bacterium]|nr:cadherin-like beta sandwich domain-containing protein [Clostridia bacterium]
MRKKVITSFMIAICVALILNFNVYGANVSAYSSNSNLNVGNTATITVDGTGVAGNISITSSNPSVVSVNSVSSDWVENSRITATIQGNIAGSANIIISGKVANLDNSSDESIVSQSITINVTEPAPPPVDKNNNQNNNNNYNNNQNNNQNTTTKDSNTYLSYLELSEEGMSPSFVKTKTSYAITVGLDVNEINISAETESGSSYYYVEGNTGLVEGDNTISVVVVAENGSTRTYYITVTKTADPEKANAYLENLVIENLKLSPEFQPEVFEYDLGEIEFNIDKLNILTFPKNENAKVEVIGNENLKEGENEIKIIVTAEDGTTTKEYILKVTKKAEVVETNALENVNERSSSQKFKDFMGNLWLSIKANALLVLMYIFIVVEFVQIVYLYKQLNKRDEILEKYGIDENGEMSTTRSGKKRELDLTQEKKINSIDIPLELEEKNQVEDNNIQKLDDAKSKLGDDNNKE